MNTKILLCLLALAFIATPVLPTYAFECEVVEIHKRNVIIQCDEKEVESAAVKVKSELKIKKIK